MRKRFYPQAARNRWYRPARCSIYPSPSWSCGRLGRTDDLRNAEQPADPTAPDRQRRPMWWELRCAPNTGTAGGRAAEWHPAPGSPPAGTSAARGGAVPGPGQRPCRASAATAALRSARAAAASSALLPPRPSRQGEHLRGRPDQPRWGAGGGWEAGLLGVS